MRMGFFLNYKDIKAKKEPRIAELLSLLFLVFHYILQKTFSGTLWKSEICSREYGWLMRRLGILTVSLNIP